MPRVPSAPLPASVFSSISVLRRRQWLSSPAAAKARLKRHRVVADEQHEHSVSM